MNEPRAALNACLFFFHAYFSPKYAQTNGPARSPISQNGQITIQKIGRIITETTSQILLPRTPRFVPQNFLVPREGTI